MSKHTPEPWRRLPTVRSDRQVRVVGGDGSLVCITSDKETTMEAVANGNLIAAAPDMCRELRRLIATIMDLNEIPEFRRITKIYPQLMNVHSDAILAIHKAEGKVL